MIYTVTLNPAIDYYIELEEFQEQELNHCENSYTIMGEKESMYPKFWTILG